mmetsp:Transcript_79409/g.245021  ORF Transcript_79409/g.245021 Transcript_79409/m.245021 type:complete len:294 (-) Transcript_79409:271-1152(-)
MASVSHVLSAEAPAASLAPPTPGSLSSPSSACRPVNTREAARCQADSSAPMRRSSRADSSWSKRPRTCVRPGPPAEKRLNSASTAPTLFAISPRSSPTTLRIRSPISMRSSASSSPTQAARATCSALPRTGVIMALCVVPVSTLALSPTSIEGAVLRVPASSVARRSARSAAAKASSARQLRSARAAQRSLRSRARSCVKRPMDRLASSKAARHEARPPWAVPSTERTCAKSSSESFWSKRDTSLRISAESSLSWSCERGCPAGAAVACCILCRSDSSLASRATSRCAPSATA